MVPLSKQVNRESLLNEIRWYVFDSTRFYLGIEFTLSCGWLEILLYIAINVLLFVLNVNVIIDQLKHIRKVRLTFSKSFV